MAGANDRRMRLAACAWHVLLEVAVDRRSAGVGAGCCRAAKRRVQVAEGRQERLLKTSEDRPGGAIGVRSWIVRRGWHQKRELAGAGREPLLGNGAA